MFVSTIKPLGGERVRPLAFCLLCEAYGVDSKLLCEKTGCDSTDLKVRTNDSSVLRRTKLECAIFGKNCGAEGVNGRVSLEALQTFIWPDPGRYYLPACSTGNLCACRQCASRQETIVTLALFAWTIFYPRCGHIYCRVASVRFWSVLSDKSRDL